LLIGVAREVLRGDSGSLGRLIGGISTKTSGGKQGKYRDPLNMPMKRGMR